MKDRGPRTGPTQDSLSGGVVLADKHDTILDVRQERLERITDGSQLLPIDVHAELFISPITARHPAVKHRAPRVTGGVNRQIADAGPRWIGAEQCLAGTSAHQSKSRNDALERRTRPDHVGQGCRHRQFTV